MSDHRSVHPRAQPPTALDHALELLTSLHEGFAGVSAVIAVGQAAVEPLKAILWRTESSGIFEVRSRAVMALSALGADEVLIDFIEAQRRIDDPTARAGEDATVSIAARTLKASRNLRAFPALLRLARRHPLPGAVEALAASQRVEAIPGLIRGLDEDDTRAAAVAGLRSLGRAARSALLAVGVAPDDAESALRRRRVAMSLLGEIGLAPWQWPEVRPLIDHPDPELGLHACLALLAARDKASKDVCRERIAALAPRLRAPLKDLATAALGAPPPPPQPPPAADAPAVAKARQRRPLLRLTLPAQAPVR